MKISKFIDKVFAEDEHDHVPLPKTSESKRRILQHIPVFKLASKPIITVQEPAKFKSPFSKSKQTKFNETFYSNRKAKESVSSVFDVEDAPLVLEIVARKVKETEKLAEFTKTKPKDKKRPLMAKNRDLNKSAEYSPSLDELLKPPERPADGGKTRDEVLDDLDKMIAERKKKHEEEMAIIQTSIAAEKRRQEERKERMKQNALLRKRLEVEITKPMLKTMFSDNKEYLQKICDGKVESSRHKAFFMSPRSRDALFYTMITDPFTDDQLSWTLEEISMVWEENSDYVWKVLLAECFIKFYMDYFHFGKEEAEKRISETPLRREMGDVDEEESSEDEL